MLIGGGGAGLSPGAGLRASGGLAEDAAIDEETVVADGGGGAVAGLAFRVGAEEERVCFGLSRSLVEIGLDGQPGPGDDVLEPGEPLARLGLERVLGEGEEGGVVGLSLAATAAPIVDLVSGHAQRHEFVQGQHARARLHLREDGGDAVVERPVALPDGARGEDFVEVVDEDHVGLITSQTDSALFFF